MNNTRVNTKFGVARRDERGYLQITSRKEGNKGRMLHRLIFEDFYKTKLPKNIVIHHNDGDPTNNNIWNLIPMRWEEHTFLHHKGREFSKEHRQHISEAMKGEKHRNYGKPLPKETREKIRQANTGHKHSEETKQKISNSHIGKTHSDESKLKMSNNRNTTGYFRVSIYRNKCYKKGYGYQYQWYDENGKRKRITAVTIEALKNKVLKKGLEWKQLLEAIQ